MNLNRFNVFCVFCLLFVIDDGVLAKYDVYTDSINGWLGRQKIIATYADAKRRCASDGGQLAFPTTENLAKEMKYLFILPKNKSVSFIDVTARQGTGDYLTPNNVPIEDLPISNMFVTLDPLEGDCIAMNDKEVKVVPCSQRLPYICYKKNKQRAECYTDDKAGCNSNITEHERELVLQYLSKKEAEKKEESLKKNLVKKN